MDLWVCNLGLVEYGDALALQERVRAARIDGRVPDVLLLVEHPPVYTRGRRSADNELPRGVDSCRGIEVVDVNRGGKVTFHGPGQLVGYPIVAVDDVVGHVRRLERVIVSALAAEGVPARSREADGPSYTGVWVEDRKIASIGVHVSRGVAMHGFALNVVNDLAPFGWVVACGLPDVAMTSVAVEKGAVEGCATPAGLAGCLRKRVAFGLASELGLRQRLVTRSRLEAAVRPRAVAPVTPVTVVAV